MPTLSRYFIKAGLLYLIAALIMATLLLARDTITLPNWIGALHPVYLHLLVVGWLTQLIMGVAYWMFPKASKDQPRGNEQLGWAVFILLNIGLLLRAFGEPLIALEPDTKLGWLLALSALLQLAAGWGFIANTWNRVKER